MSAAQRLERPVFLVGAARSGTKIIGATLARHPDLAFWDEPKYVWRHGAHGARDDRRTAAEATPAVAAAIRGKFGAFLRESGRLRFLEKTPSNCFRVEFMHAIFPDGLFLHVIRDGRDAAASALQRWRTKPDDAALWRRLRNFEVPLTALPHYLPDLLREAVLRRLQPGRGHVWGPRYPGIDADLPRLSTVELCARQWVECERAAVAGLATLPRAQVLHFRYEEFARDTPRVLGEILRFAGLRASPELDRAARVLRQDSIGGWRKLPADEQAVIERVCTPAMQEWKPA